MKSTFPFGVPLAAVALVTGCRPVSAQAVPFVATSKTIVAKGEYSSVAVDQVTSVAAKNGQLVLRGSTDSVTVSLPAAIDTENVVRHWALVTEASHDTRKVLTFTHDQTLDDFTIELPSSGGEVRYGVFASRAGGEVMVLAWGVDRACYWGYITLERAPSSPPGR